MNKPNSKKPALPGSTVTMRLDIGYGVVKAVTADKVVMFPSVMSHDCEVKFQHKDMARRHPSDQITDEDGDWVCGQLALAQLPPDELLRLRGRTANESTTGMHSGCDWHSLQERYTYNFGDG